MNPNNCETCSHRAYPDGGWCYMFRHEPTEVCAKHTLKIASGWSFPDMPSLPSLNSLMPGPDFAVKLVNIGADAYQMAQSKAVDVGATVLETTQTFASSAVDVAASGMTAAGDAASAGIDAVVSAGEAVADGAGAVVEIVTSIAD